MNNKNMYLFIQNQNDDTQRRDLCKRSDMYKRRDAASDKVSQDTAYKRFVHMTELLRTTDLSVQSCAVSGQSVKIRVKRFYFYKAVP